MNRLMINTHNVLGYSFLIASLFTNNESDNVVFLSFIGMGLLMLLVAKVYAYSLTMVDSDSVYETAKMDLDSDLDQPIF